MPALSPTTVVGVPQPDWLIDRECLGSRLPPRVRARELWAGRRAAPRASGRTMRRCSRSGTWNARASTDQRRRDAARELLESLRHRSRGSRLDNPGVAIDPPATRTPVPRSSIHRRARPSRCGTSSFLRRKPTGRSGLRSRARSDAQQAAERYYPDEESLCSRTPRRQRGGARSEAAGADIRPDRRAVPAGATRASPRVRLAAIARALEGRRPARPRCNICFATATSSTTSPRYSFLTELNDCAAPKSRSRRPAGELDLSV